MTKFHSITIDFQEKLVLLDMKFINSSKIKDI